MKKIYLFIVCFLTINSIVAQQEQIKPCGTDSPNDYNKYDDSNIYKSSNSTFTVPPNYCMNVFFRFVGNDDGTEMSFNPNNLNQLLTEMNSFYSTHQISFINVGYEIINNTSLNNGTISIPNVPNAINVIIQKRIPFGNTSVAGIAYTGSQLIKLAGHSYSIPTDTFIHEMGHMLNLLHTHHCYCDGYGESFNPNCAELLPDSVYPECEVKGDMICDTPPDPLHCTSSGVNISAFHPDKTNYMSYYPGFENIASTHLTQGQGVRMRDAILNKPSLQSARSNKCAIIEGPTNLCNNLQFSYSITAYGNPIVYQWTAGPNLQIVSGANSANVIVEVINPDLNVSTTLSVTLNGVTVTPITLNTASLSNYNSGAYITVGSGGTCAVGDTKTFTINNLQPTETFLWSISDSNIADITPNGNQASVTVTGNGSGPQTVMAKITNSCGQTSKKTKTFYIGVPTFNKFTYGCTNRSLCITSDASYAFTSPTILNTKNRVIANFFGLTATEAANSANWQWQEAPGNHLLYINTTSPKNYLDLCPIAAGTTILQVRAKNNTCPDFSEWVDLPITIVQLPSSMSFRQSQSPGIVSLRADDSSTLGNIENTQYYWASNNIWVRNNQDGIIEHQNPTFNESSPNYVYVRIANTGCTGLPAGIRLKTYWAKAATSLNWPQSWNDAKYNNTDTSLGGQIGEVVLPELDPEQETIISMPFMVPNPDKYENIVNEPWRFGLLARVEPESSENESTETEDLLQNIINNESLALNNVTVVDFTNDNLDEQTIGGVIAVGNTFDTTKSFYLELVKEDLETGKPIYDEAEVSLKLDETLYQAWVRGGKTAERIENTLDDKIKLIKDNNVFLKDIELNAHETGTLYLKFNFLTKEITDKSKYVYHVIQRETGTNKIIGGETYVIKKQGRPLFSADAGGTKYVDKNEPITISASQISESAVYNWYDSEGNLVCTGKDLSIATDIAQKFKLEVITTDGFKDYSEVEVKLNPNTLGTISPNPAVDNVNISYKLNEVSSAYLMIIGSHGTIGDSNNYILDLNSSETSIDLSYYSSGFYTVALVCDGQIVDAKTLVKQ